MPAASPGSIRTALSFRTVIQGRFFPPICCAALTVLSGLVLWAVPLGEPLANASYDYLFRFGSGTTTNKVVLIQMDNDSYDVLHQERRVPWSRSLHAILLNRLADDECRLVVLDIFFPRPLDPTVDQELAKAMRRLTNVVLMAKQAELTRQDLVGARPLPPTALFLEASRTNWGVAYLDPNADLDQIVRRHWPFPSPGPYPSLPWKAAEVAGARLSEEPQNRWMRYYGPDGAWERLSYQSATGQVRNYFRHTTVFVGSKPETTLPGDEPEDEFQTPYTRWSGESSGGVEIQVAAFLNLLQDDWLRRPSAWVEIICLLISGILVGVGFFRARPLAGLVAALGLGIILSLGAITVSHVTDYWFPWLVVVVGQVPIALVAGLVMGHFRRPTSEAVTQLVPTPPLAQPALNVASVPGSRSGLDAPDYELMQPHFGEGAYGKVWVAKNAIGQWQALKAVYQSKFKDSTAPYEREFRGIKNYKPVSHKHPGLLRIEFVSTKKPEGYFYYVMELGDAQEPGWENVPGKYKPRDLANLCAQHQGRRLPLRECVQIVMELAETLQFLHEQGLTHRDIKPSNIIFVNDRPKLADVGLVVETGLTWQEISLVGTPGYMPPEPEPLGTAQADIYALGMVLYVISTGYRAATFPEISTTLVDQTSHAAFMRLNAIILRACEPDRTRRYASAAELRMALVEVDNLLQRNPP